MISRGRRHRNRVSARLLVIITMALLLATPPAGANGDTPTPTPSETTTRVPGVFVVDNLFGDDEVLDRGLIESSIQPDPSVQQRVQVAPVTTPAGGFTVCHNGSIPSDVLADVVGALDTWASTIALTGPPIAIDLQWVSLDGNGTLGVAGPTEFVLDSQLPFATLGYPVALANQLLGRDTNGAGCGEDHSEIGLFLDSTAGGDGSLWNIGDDDASSSQVDLSTVVLHEVGHGLGVVSSARLVNDSIEWPRSGAPTYVYDHFFGVCANESAVGCDTEPSSSVSSEDLRGARLWFAGLGGRSLELHAPIDWSGGSSVSHLDEVRYPGGGTAS